MKNLLLLTIALFLSNLAISQSFSSPESIVYDSVGNRYFVSNKDGNTIVIMDSEGNLSDFVTEGLNEPKGLVLVGDTLISVNSGSIQAFLISDSSQVFNVAVDGAIFMNDGACDGMGNLYVSDTQVGRIVKLNLTTLEYGVVATGIPSPNGLLFDEGRNALLICSWGSNSKIQALSFADSSLTVLIQTKLSNLDGLAQDNCGNIYVSSWGSNAVYVYDYNFSEAPTKISAGHSGPADISIDESTQIMGVPNFNSNTIDFVDLYQGCKIEANYLLPENNSTQYSDSVLLDWQNVDGAMRYLVEYSTDSLFYSQVTRVEVENSEFLLTDLVLDTKYFWRVCVLTEANKAIFGTVWNVILMEQTTTIRHPQGALQQVYPNPFTQGLKFSNTLQKLEVYNVAGQLLFSKTGSLRSIDLSSLNNGIYFIQGTTESKTFKARVVKQ